MLGVPEELGGVMTEQFGGDQRPDRRGPRPRRHGHRLRRVGPGAAATAIGLWASAEQEATYLPAFTGEDIPAAALAILEPRPLFDPFELETKAEKEW